MIFSAIALVAFSVTSMAGEIEGKENVAIVTPCETYAQQAYRSALINTQSGIYAEAMYLESLETCEQALKDVDKVMKSIR
jgi:hypothetical protein